MEKINKLIGEIKAECEKLNISFLATMVDMVAGEFEKQGTPFLATFGTDEIEICEYAPPHTPERIKKARITLVNTTMHERRRIKIQA